MTTSELTSEILHILDTNGFLYPIEYNQQGNIVSISD